MKIRIVLADDQKIFCHELISFLNKRDEIEIVVQAENGRETVELVHELKPDIIIMDINAPELNGINVVHEIAQKM